MSFTLDELLRIKRELDKIPPAPMLASSRLFPAEHALRFMHEGREYVCAHPDFWALLPHSERGTAYSSLAVNIINLESPLYAKERTEVFTAMRAVTREMLDDMQERGA